MFGYVKKFVDERDVVKIITEFTHGKACVPDTTLFSNLLFDPVGYEGLEEYNGYYVAINVPREEFEFVRQGNRVVPGDFDIIFIPYNSTKLFFDRTAVFEVKVARPDIRRADKKSSNSIGTKQVHGLLEDGFPLVGLLHVCMPEPLKELHAIDMKLYKYPIGDESYQPPGRFEDEDNFEVIKHDWMPSYAVRKQMQRMISSDLPKYVGINAFGMSLNPDGTYACTSSHEYRGYHSGYFNPSRNKAKAIKCIEKHFLKYGTSVYRKLEIWDRPQD